MASLGTFLLLASFVACSYATVISVAGARRGSRRLIESGIGAFYLVCALMTVASAVIVNAFIVYDGESIWLEGLALIGLYCIIAASFWWG